MKRKIDSGPKLLRRTAAVLAAAAAMLLGLLVPVSPADAAVSHSLRMARMWGWTQPERASYDSWVVGLENQSRWTEYDFTWATDFCSSSPDEPGGFDFRMSCRRHDFGYRNYNRLGEFAANKSRVDYSFYRDLLRKCETYFIAVRPACNGLAWTYYQAVVNFGSLVVSQDVVDYYAAMKEQAHAGATADQTAAAARHQ
jgi:hypothetical protein